MNPIDRLLDTLEPSLRGIDREAIRTALAGLEPALAAKPGPRTQLSLRRLRFSGEKKADFRFFQGVNVLRAGNDKGKSSVLKLIHFCLTGKNDLKKDVDGWIEFVELYFDLDGQPFAIEVHKTRRPRGRILACREDRPEDLERAEVLAEFRHGKAMQQELEAFFNQRFGLRPLMGTQKDSRKRSDRLLDAPTSYRAYVRGLYVTQDLGYTTLVTEGVPYGNLFMKIVGMLLGLRGLDAVFATEARLSHVENQLGKEERYHRRLEASLGLRDLPTLDAEISRLQGYIDQIKSDRTGLLVRATSNELDRRLGEATDRLLALEEARLRTTRAVQTAEAELAETEAEVERLDVLTTSTELFAPISPDRWPFLDLELTAEQQQRAREATVGHIERMRRVAGERLAEAKSNLAAQRRTIERRRAELQELEFRADQLAQQKRHLQTQLKGAHQSTAELDREIELEIRYLGKLEAEREAVARMVTRDAGGSNIEHLVRQKTILEAALRHLRGRWAADNEERKQEFARRIQEYCTTIGFPALQDITLDAKLEPRIRQNDEVYGFDELSPGEKVRFVLAFYLGLAIATAEDLDHGAHPGLLLIDSPGKEEMVEGDFGAVVKLLSQIEDRHAHSIQVIVATSIPAIRGATQISKQFYIDDDDEPVFG